MPPTTALHQKGGRLAKYLLLDEIHVSFLIPRELPDRAAAAVRRALDGARFRAGLRRCLRAAMRREPALARVRLRVTR